MKRTKSIRLIDFITPPINRVECDFESTSFVVAIFYKGGWFSRGYYIDELNDIIIKSDGSIEIENYNSDTWSDSSLEEAEGRLNTANYDFELIYSAAEEEETAETEEESAEETAETGEESAEETAEIGEESAQEAE